MSDSSLGDVVQSIAGVIQACVALGAFFIAKQANGLSAESNKLAVESVRRQQLLGLIAEVVRESREVVPCYRDLFNNFSSTDEKVAQRTKWIQTRDKIGELLLVYSDAFHVFAAAREQWIKLEELEDSHATSDSISSPDIRMIDTAMKRYREQYSKFLKVLGSSS